MSMIPQLNKQTRQTGLETKGLPSACLQLARLTFEAQCKHVIQQAGHILSNIAHISEFSGLPANTTEEKSLPVRSVGML